MRFAILYWEIAIVEIPLSMQLNCIACIQLGAIGRRYTFFWQGCNKGTAGVGVFITEMD